MELRVNVIWGKGHAALNRFENPDRDDGKNVKNLQIL